MQIVSSKRRRGTALLEGVIAIGVILVGVVGSLVLLNTSINLGRANQDRIVGQNLSREGLELAYSLRNSASMRRVDDPTTSWSDYLLKAVLKSDNPTIFCNRFNLGDLTGPAPQTCKQISPTTNDASHTTENDDQADLCGGGVKDIRSDIDDQRLCDVHALSNYLVSEPGFTGLPPGCAGNVGDPGHLPNAPVNCNYDGQGLVDISDLSLFIYNLYLESFQFGYGYPSISSVSGSVDAQFDFNNPYGSNFTPSTGRYTSLDPIWQDSRARVYTDASSSLYFQNATIAGSIPTKYYRVVSMQPICRGTLVATGATAEVVTDAMSGYNCVDYIAHNPGFGWNTSVSTVGALVTSEVRWPTPTSPNKVRYQEFLYDWISL